MEKATPFKHDFKNTDIDVTGINGYTQCLKSIYDYLADVTQFNPAKRMIDAVDMLEKIASTSEELGSLIKLEQIRLNNIINAELN